MKNQKVTMVLPVLNEEKTIEEIINRCKPYADHILVVVALKSSDKTAEIAKSLGAEVIYDGGQGKGDGIRCAINHVQEGIIVFIDADGSHIPEDIPRLVDPLQADKADMVIGSRCLGGSEELHGDFSKSLRMFFSICISQIINWRFHTTIGDTQNGFRSIKVDAAKQLNLVSRHTEIETEMNMKCCKKGFRVMEVPSMELKRRYGQSSVKLPKHAWKYVWAVFRNLF